MAQDRTSTKADSSRNRDEEGRFTETVDSPKASDAASNGKPASSDGSSKAKDDTKKASSGSKGSSDKSSRSGSTGPRSKSR